MTPLLADTAADISFMGEDSFSRREIYCLLV